MPFDASDTGANSHDMSTGSGFAVTHLMKTMFAAVQQLEGAMTYHRDRHSVLAGNVSNVDTPGYRPKDLVRTERASFEAVSLTLTNSGHLESQESVTQTVESFEDSDEYQSPDGNAVSLERELAKIDANRVRYTTSAELVSRRLALLRYAAGDGV